MERHLDVDAYTQSGLLGTPSTFIMAEHLTEAIL
jgi:hypothetical protein